ncbi:MAG: hypothetical protein JSV41_01920 [Gemmatimonadota bacterium]|nr:MAG: hypothetical protein JSV41_01920 [Gemmatimonadota bacterium]
MPQIRIVEDNPRPKLSIILTWDDGSEWTVLEKKFRKEEKLSGLEIGGVPHGNKVDVNFDITT